ncbi:MAG: hypothetical protein OER82_01310 [Nitrosopumilus sp.]|nr:hypothetical protein [Nitrosopumilus sp.]
MMFQESLRSKESIKTYTWTVDQFIKYHNLKKKNYDGAVAIDEKEFRVINLRLKRLIIRN